MAKKPLLAARVTPQLHQQVTHLAWLTQRSVNDVLLSIIEPAVAIIYEDLETQQAELSATEQVELNNTIDIEALKRHTEFMERNINRTKYPFPRIKRTPPPPVPARSNRGAQTAKARALDAEAAAVEDLQRGLDNGTIDVRTHQLRTEGED